MKNDKKQLRKTRSDCIIAQKKMREIVLNKIKGNEVLTINEIDIWMETVADALMTWGKNTKAYIDLPYVKIPFGSVHTFALRFMDWGNPAIVIHENKDYKFQIKELWKLLYEYMLLTFPNALDEALHISKESEERERWGSYEFSAKKSMESPTSY